MLQEFVGDDSLGRIWIATDNDSYIGYIVLAFGYSFEYRGRDAFIDELFVSDQYRGKGIGSLLLEHTQKESRKLDLKVLHLEVEKENKGAYDLYKRSGFEDHDRYLMSKKV